MSASLARCVVSLTGSCTLAGSTRNTTGEIGATLPKEKRAMEEQAQLRRCL
jgi:hypothetical protein